MKKEWRKTVSAICLAWLLVLLPASSLPAKTPSEPPPTVTQQSDQTQSVTGTIATVGRNSFTLTLTSAINRDQHSQDTPRTMTFVIDKNTTIDGRLRVGASADVTYRQQNGNYIAINVRVAS
jgi:hypothetical protein